MTFFLSKTLFQVLPSKEGIAIKASTASRRFLALIFKLSNQRMFCMNKSELIDAIAQKGGLTKVDAAKALDATLESIGDALKSGDTVTLVGFGSFSVKERAARTGRNPKTGEELKIPASKVPSFKAGKGLKDSVA
jgi:DNA-binding protein HU-beta